MRNFYISILIFCLCLLPIISTQAKTYNPLQYGLNNAHSGVERYWVLYKTHELAKNNNGKVIYNGIDSLDIEIPRDAISIPLSEYTDFCGVVLTVKNSNKDMFLFEMSQSPLPVAIDKETVDEGVFNCIPPLNSGLKLLILNDKKPWVKQRNGYNYGHQRKDLLLIKGGIARNTPIFPYNTCPTEAEAEYCEVSSKQKVLKNLTFYRQRGNKKIIKFVLINNQYNIKLNNISFFTPKDSLYGDQIISIVNSFKVCFNNIRINGTYSSEHNYGYGISLNNVSDVTFNRLFAEAAWGIFGNNNVNGAQLSNCDINRFDIHCYGKDVVCKKCVFRDLYNQFSSMNGTVVFENCVFIDFIPFLFENSYNVYPKFDLIFNECTVYASKVKNYLVDARSLAGGETKEREELRFQHYPNLIVNGLTVYLQETDSYYSYRLGRQLLKWNQEEIICPVSFNRIKFANIKKL